MLTGSGMGAAATAVLSLVKAGDHVIAQHSMYAGVTSIIQQLLPGLGVQTTQVDQQDIDAFRSALRPNTRLLMLESASDPLLEVTDLELITAYARQHGAVTLVDNTFATPRQPATDPTRHRPGLAQRHEVPGGHADLMAGVILGRREHIAQLWNVQVARIGPRAVQCVAAPARVADTGDAGDATQCERPGDRRFLSQHRAVDAVHYPGLPTHRLHDVARRQMSGFGGVLGCDFKSGFDAADAFIDRLTLARRPRVWVT